MGARSSLRPLCPLPHPRARHLFRSETRVQPRVLLVPSACPSSPLRPSPAGRPPAVTGSLPLPGAASGPSSEAHRLLWVSRDRAGRNCFSAQEAHCQAHAWPSFRATACVPRQRLGSQPGVPCCSPQAQDGVGPVPHHPLPKPRRNQRPGPLSPPSCPPPLLPAPQFGFPGLVHTLP